MFLEPLVADVLADEGPVFLFDVSVIVLVIGTRTSVLNRALSVLEVFEDGPVQKFTSVIAIKTENGERQFLFDIFDSFKDTSKTNIPSIEVPQ